MPNRKKIGPRVDEDVWERFRKYVRDKHGGTKNVLSRELEAALEEHMEPNTADDRLTRIEDDVATVKAMLAETDGDGGYPAPASSRSQTHAPADGAERVADDVQEKPASNQPRAEKVQYLAQQARQQYDGVCTRDDIRDIIRDEYGFRSDTVDEYLGLVIERLDAQPDPRNEDALIAWGDGLERARQQAQEAAQDDAAATQAALDEAEPARR